MAEENFDLRTGDENEHSTNASNQPDSGRAANLILIGCSILQLPIWGKTIC